MASATERDRAGSKGGGGGNNAGNGKDAETSSGGMSGDLENLKTSFNQLRNDVADLLSQAMGVGRTGAGVARNNATDALDQLKTRFAELKDRGNERVADVEKRIEDKPLQSTLIAFGIGFVLAKILTRR